MSSTDRVTHALAWGALALGAVLCLSACEDRAQADDASAARQSPSRQPRLETSQRTGRLRRYPCTDCHRVIAASETTGRYVSEHAELRLRHFAAIEQCRLCHDPSDMNGLALLDGTHTSFDEAQQVCGQCHGEKLRDFSIGAHGKLMGSYRSLKYRFVCTDCHDPHAPRQARVTALPAPPFPALGIPKGHQP